MEFGCPKTASLYRVAGYYICMTEQDDIFYRALRSKDHRFDGVFFVGVASTRIYCRPVCTAKTPGRNRCTFYRSPALAEQAGFRPCLRCRPELAPGQAPIDQSRTIAMAAATRIEAGALREGSGLEELASSLGVSSRQLRRCVRQELGVSPVQLAQTNRLLLAKRLITETQLPITQIAFAAGFGSVRRFNTLFQRRYRLAPGTLRRKQAQPTSHDCFQLQLAYRPPFDWNSLLNFLAARATAGVEVIDGGTYRRTVGIGSCDGWLSVTNVVDRHLLRVELATTLAPVLPSVLVRLQNLFDLDARPDVVDAQLATHQSLQGLVARHPGLRVPGAFDCFELGARAILGQQITVRGASTLAGRLVRSFGQRISTPYPDLWAISPTAESLSAAPIQTICDQGLTRTRAQTLQHFATAIAKGDVDLEPGCDPPTVARKLQQIAGIGPWTAEYILMRALRWPDAFPTGDRGLQKALGSTSAKVLRQVANCWRPWRAYAAMHLWTSLSESSD